jgi:hypothetical protein
MKASLSFPAVISKIAVYSAVMLAYGVATPAAGSEGSAPPLFERLGRTMLKSPPGRKRPRNISIRAFAWSTHSITTKPFGLLRTLRGRYDEGIRALKDAIRLEGELPYTEPSLWHQPIRHHLATVLLSAGQAAEAEQVYREDLRRSS